jgi:glycosyltransferase involved in cell wall biosynthesis
VSDRDNLFIASSAYLKIGLARLATEFPAATFTTITSEEFASRLAEFMRRFRRYERVVFYTYDFDTSRTVVWHAIVWWLARHGTLLDGRGRKRAASLWGLIVRDGLQLLIEPLLLLYVLGRASRDLSVIESKERAGMPERLSIAYLRTDHWFGTKAGGSVTHIAGVANSFRDHGVPLFFLSSDRLELIDESQTPLTLVRPSKSIRNIPDAPQIAYNLRLIAEANKTFSFRTPTLIYQRYSQYNYSGAFLAAAWKLPFVLEYNGSEVWMARHWGKSFRFQRFAEDIEIANLKAADAVIVVSAPMKAELVGRGIEARKILVNPNGVDLKRFDPDAVREKAETLKRTLGLKQKIVVGFIGTFGKWHGAEVLARAIRGVVDRDRRLHFLFIGDGVSMPDVRRIVEETGVGSHVTFAGMVPQEEGPVWLGACDILASPHVPNPDGSPFFGSPTKLFEYMAMGRAIVASRLDQIGEVLRHNETALLVTPGSSAELVDGILALAADPEKGRRLGENARLEVAEKYTWSSHVRRIMDHLETCLSK